MAVSAPDGIRDVNARYHDYAAADYDAKWGIDYGRTGQRQVVRKVAKALGHRPGAYERALEIGAGTGYFSLNLLRAGVVAGAMCTDVSEGMLRQLRGSARSLGLPVETARCEAESLPFADDSFDLVLGHAVLHHLPDLDAAFREFRRVLRPGGTVVFCGEPSRYGDRLAGAPKRLAAQAAPVWRALMRASPRPETNGSAAPDDSVGLEWLVDVHAFTPSDLAGHARHAGFERVRVTGEELAASWFGWTNRALEATADPREIPWAWRQYAYRGYLALQAVDRSVLEPRLPAAIFYNLLVSARAPGRS